MVRTTTILFLNNHCCRQWMETVKGNGADNHCPALEQPLPLTMAGVLKGNGADNHCPALEQPLQPTMVGTEKGNGANNHCAALEQPPQPTVIEMARVYGAEPSERAFSAKKQQHI